MMRIADPRPGFCSICLQGGTADVRFVDCDVAYDGQAILDRESGAIAIIPWSGEIASHDNLYVCEGCAREIAETLGARAELHERQREQIRKLTVEARHWREYAKRLEATLVERPDPVRHVKAAV